MPSWVLAASDSWETPEVFCCLLGCRLEGGMCEDGEEPALVSGVRLLLEARDEKLFNDAGWLESEEPS